MAKEVVANRQVLFEGLREDEILSLPKEEVFSVGSATLLGSFSTDSEQLRIELAQIDGGGEGVLMAVASLARRYAALHNMSRIEWIVHAVSCARPNPKLRRVLELRGFAVKRIAGIGEAYYFVDHLQEKIPARS